MSFSYFWHTDSFERNTNHYYKKKFIVFIEMQDINNRFTFFLLQLSKTILGVNLQSGGTWSLKFELRGVFITINLLIIRSSDFLGQCNHLAGTGPGCFLGMLIFLLEWMRLNGMMVALEVRNFLYPCS